jgi:hypothetical protein
MAAVESDRAQRVTRRRFLMTAGGVAAAGSVAYVVGRGVTYSGPQVATRSAGGGPAGLNAFAANLVPGGPGKDGIPAIDRPRFIVPRPGLLADDDVVFGLAHSGQIRAYPQLILVWHEIVNDRFADGPLSITYCPLAGSVIGYRGRAPGGRPYTFGTTGELVNSSLLMYDRQTGSTWPQILGEAITGPARGHALEAVPLEWTTWGRWRTLHPGTRVLSTQTGYLRPYGTDPYGSYTPLSGYYSDGNIIFPVMRYSRRFPAKEAFIAVTHRQAHIAARKQALRERGVLTIGVAGGSVIFLYDPALDDGNAFVPHASGGLMRLARLAGRPGYYRDAASGSVWDASGTVVQGPSRGAVLPRLPAFNVMWFAWYAFFPRTAVLA